MERLIGLVGGLFLLVVLSDDVVGFCVCEGGEAVPVAGWVKLLEQTRCSDMLLRTKQDILLPSSSRAGVWCCIAYLSA